MYEALEWVPAAVTERLRKGLGLSAPRTGAPCREFCALGLSGRRWCWCCCLLFL